MLCFMLGMVLGIPVLIRLSPLRGTRFGVACAMLGAAISSLAFPAPPSRPSTTRKGGEACRKKSSGRLRMFNLDATPGLRHRFGPSAARRQLADDHAVLHARNGSGHSRVDTAQPVARHALRRRLRDAGRCSLEPGVHGDPVRRRNDRHDRLQLGRPFHRGYQFILNAAMVALASLDRAESGRDQVSLHLALLAMTNNIGYAVAVGIVNGLLQLFHYQAGAPEGNATWAVIGLGLVLPAFLFIAAAMNFVARSEAHTSDLQSLMRISYSVFCLTQTHNT